ncbi:MAG TPA: multicopper oxidase domain-containing protein [Planctomycetota bacterium]|jgi:FtsP/CotA-like multicopper oxidase with cupredoxin domain|nr:multicopper oxidase domain-containing protein [Planctomycetota bacterium]
MKSFMRHALVATLALGFIGVAGGPAAAGTFIQCPGDTDIPLDGVPDVPVCPGDVPCLTPDDPDRRDVKCAHLTAGDGFTTMADGRRLYMFGYANVTGVSEPLVMSAGEMAHASAAPTLVMDEGQEFYLTLTNVGMQIRPDLFDAHTVHFHGFPNASIIFDGVPENSISINQGSSQTYYYNLKDPGTYMYHCHVEATEHMQMGMIGNLWVRPAQNKLPHGTDLGGYIHINPDNYAGNTHPALDDATDGSMYAYNDGDAATRYDVEFPIQITSWDSAFHQASEDVQPLPFAGMEDDYGLLNGRGYPESADPRGLDFTATPGSGANPGNTESPFGHLQTSQPVSTLVTVDKSGGEVLVLLRMNNVSITRSFTLATTLGVPMKVVGIDQRMLRGGGLPDGEDYMYDTNSVQMLGGETVDVIIDVTDVPTGTYFLYSTDLNYLSNDAEDFGGVMTEIIIN